MNPLFIQGYSPSFRVFVFVTVSLVLMTVDHRLHYLKSVRSHLSVVVYPLQYLVDFPVKASHWLSQGFGSRLQLLSENSSLREENLRLRFTLQKLQDLKNENERLRSLLGATTQFTEKVLVAEVLAVDLDPFTRRMLIDKGSEQGVFDGQPLLDARGVMGQIVNVGPFSSTLMLITDPNHALPVQVERSGLRTIAVGMGAVNRLELLYLPNNSDIVVGDKLVTSGLGGQFPPGYPVGEVVEVNPDIARPYAQVQAIPHALLERNREVLLIWNIEPDPVIVKDHHPGTSTQ
ncbi:rod shape-determining protein MreC [Beggiatoa leptomitoformis]|uniref:Cell shape-determining protein MreC n=1 Tax=Beggiatoa leptomitoformis TaxID=288004 RepID=A0A2N9YDH3_9GAMM|nr:rod shape-determining protein MreC [Beggiatoa leptomitoformis]AUI68409.1 rod shape-determining protein MreC [Beggiatoa leptomitoformis]